MAKKVQLADLDSGEKKKLGKVSFFTIFSVFLVCVFVVSCFACSQDGGNHLTDGQQAEADRLYWTSVLNETKWTVSTSDKNDGKLEDFTITLDLEFKYESSTGKLTALFKSGVVTALSGELTLVSSKGSIATTDGKNWDVKFSEKGNVMYLTITCSNGKDVYYTCNK